MSLPAGTHALGPKNGTLSVRTGRTGAAAKAGHDLLIHVAAWEATLEVGEDLAQTSIALDVDSTSLRVREGTGGMQPLGRDDKASIETTIDDEVLKGQAIQFRSTDVQAGIQERFRPSALDARRGTRFGHPRDLLRRHMAVSSRVSRRPAVNASRCRETRDDTAMWRRSRSRG